tara:strand:- start:245 stop:457 length:213 start_codon:yes stop_codon:yes gene_type:complete
METFAYIMTLVLMISAGLQVACWAISTFVADLGFGDHPTSKEQLTNAWNNFCELDDDISDDEYMMFFHKR